MTNPAPPPQLPNPPNLADEIRRLVIMWAACCASPIVYLAATWVIKKYFLQETGFFPLSPGAWDRALIGLAIFVVILQSVHLLIKYRYRPQLAHAMSAPAEYAQLLTRRTLILIFLSEMSVFSGFCLFLLQGNPLPVFGSGIAAMFFYAQSHPRSFNPAA